MFEVLFYKHCLNVIYPLFNKHHTKICIIQFHSHISLHFTYFFMSSYYQIRKNS